jgi:hypothetical protein
VQLLPCMRQELLCRECVWDRDPLTSVPVEVLLNSGEKEDGKEQSTIIQAEPVSYPGRNENLLACPCCRDGSCGVEVCRHPIAVRYA